jgi:hypothetical protein
MISFTEEMVLSPEHLPKGVPKGWRFYRCELWTEDDQVYPYEHGYLWLPPHVDITKVEEVVNREG